MAPSATPTKPELQIPRSPNSGAAKMPPTRTYTITGLAGLNAYMATTADRDEIGPITEAQGKWIGTGSNEALEDMLAQAEASGTIPWHMRDEKTGAPFNFDQSPRGGWNSGPPDMNDPPYSAIEGAGGT